MKKRFGKKSGMGFTLLAVIVLCVVLAFPMVRMKAKEHEQKETKARCEQRIAELENEKQEIDEYKEYVKSDEYIEDVARDKLGLVHPGDIVFEPEED